MIRLSLSVRHVHDEASRRLKEMSRRKAFAAARVYCRRVHRAVNFSQERMYVCNSVSLIAGKRSGTDYAGRLENRERLQRRLPDRGSAGLASVIREYGRGGVS